MKAPHPTHAAPAAAPAATPAGSMVKAPLWAFVVGAGILLALADTRAAPLAVAIVTAAVVFQVLNL